MKRVGSITGLKDRKKPWPYALPVDELEMLSEAYKDPYTLNLFRQCYLFGQRSGEAILAKRKDFQYQEHEGTEVLVLNSITEKNRAMPLRILPTKLDNPMAIHFSEWVMDRKENIYKDWTIQKAYNQISKRGKLTFEVMALVPDRTQETSKAQWTLQEIKYTMHPHYLRHCCLTHKVQNEDYGIPQLMTFAGWTDPSPALIYVHLNWRDLIA